MMHCYFCQRATTATPAVAICQGCGAACCLEHLEEWNSPGYGPGLQPVRAPKVEILCQRCVALRMALFAGARQKIAGHPAASSALAASASVPLPEAQEVVSRVEDLLRLQRSTSATTVDSLGWRRFFKRLRAR